MNFRHLFRLIFVIFFLYLAGDAFYRWDGFKYYASFYEFLPSVALISVLWIIVAVIATIIIWLPLKIFNWISRCLKLKVSSEHVFLNTWFLVFIGVIVWISKKVVWPDAQTTLGEKLIVVLSTVLLSVFLTWILRNKAERLIGTISDHITPLVWIFGVIVGLSLPLVIVYALWEPSDKTIPSGSVQSLKSAGNRPNIILVTYDALTAKDMSVYGYHKPTTPFISDWAKSATVFTKCEASATATWTTVPSLMMGQRVWTHGRYHSDAGKPANIDIENFPLLLKNSGYYNLAFAANDRADVENLNISDSFDVKPSFYETIMPASINGFFRKYLFKYFSSKIILYDWILIDDFLWNRLLQFDFIIEHPYKTENPPEKVFDMFLSEINNNYREPFFAWLHLFPPHSPYLPPEPYMGMFDPSPKFRTAKSQRALINPNYYNPEQYPDVEIVRSRYDENIRYSDNAFEQFIKQLSLKNNLNKTVVILSADHGESFEHGVLRHGSPKTLFEEMTNIPLIIKELSQFDGRIIDFPVEQIDIPATILELANIPVPPWMEGRSLAPFLRGEELQSRPVFSMELQEVPARGQVKINKGVVAVWEGDYKLIYRLTTKETLLFNLKLDPNELNNIFPTETKVGQHLLNLIQDNLKKTNERISRGK